MIYLKYFFFPWYFINGFLHGQSPVVHNCKTNSDCYGFELCCDYWIIKMCCYHNFTTYPALKPVPVRVPKTILPHF